MKPTIESISHEDHEANRLATEKSEAAWARYGQSAVGAVFTRPEGDTTPADGTAVVYEVTEPSVLPVMTEESTAGFDIKDRRRTSLKKVEADFEAKQEALRAPLTVPERGLAIKKLLHAVEQKTTVNDTAIEADRRRDLEGDQDALYRLRQLVSGESIGRGQDAHNQHEGMSIEGRLDDLVKQYSRLVPENYPGEKERRFIDSVGGTVKVGENGQIHNDGYNGSLLYQFARARQIWETMESKPEMIREEVLNVANGETLDTAWITEQPVTVSPEDTALPTAA